MYSPRSIRLEYYPSNPHPDRDIPSYPDRPVLVAFRLDLETFELHSTTRKARSGEASNWQGIQAGLNYEYLVRPAATGVDT